MTRVLADVLKREGITVEENVPTAPLCTIRIGGVAALLLTPACKNELITAVRILRAQQYPFALIGRGSNVLFADGYLSVALIRTTHLDAFRFTEKGVLADAGVSLISLAGAAARRGFADLAFASGIPGTLGGALFMNAGAYGDCIANSVISVTAYDPEKDKIKTFFKGELNYSYRKSVFQQNNCIILSAELALDDVGEPAQILARMRAQNAHRRATQPLEYPSAGSVFCRPTSDLPISAMLDEIGCKGMRVGDAAVSEKHAGFIVNRGEASAKDVMTLIERLQNKLEKERGIRPQTELRLVPRET